MNRRRNNSESEEAESRSRSRSEERSGRRRSRRDSSNDDRRKNSRSRNRDESRERSEENNQEECSELFVRNLPWKADEEVVSEFFSKFGKVQNVKILYDRQTGKAKGIGFVNFANRQDAEAAISNNDDLEIDGRKIEVNFSNQRRDRERPNNRDREREPRRDDRRREPNAESKTIFVGNLSFKSDEETIKEFFESCGKIVDVRIANGPNGRSKGFCHVDFDSIESASKATRKSGENLDGRDIRVDFSSERREGGNRDRGDRGDRGDRYGGRDGYRGGRGGRGGSRGGHRNFNRDRY